jgi:transcription elongation factor Elf1
MISEVIDSNLAFVYKYKYHCPFCGTRGVLLTKEPEESSIVNHSTCGCEIKISEDIMVWN